MSATTNQATNTLANKPVNAIRLPSFKALEAQLIRSKDHSLHLAPIRKIDIPLPPRPVALHPDYHWQEYLPEKCTCSGATIVREQHATLPTGHYATFSAPTSPSAESCSTRPNNAQQTTLRPRWRPEERRSLFKAVVLDKDLEDMATFNWDSIAAQVGRTRKACKDQWRREVLRSIFDFFDHQILSGRNLGFLPREHDDDQDLMDDDISELDDSKHDMDFSD